MKKLLFITFLLQSFILFSQQNITGTVTDSTGVPLPGASVSIENTGIGTTTDFDGNFSIEATIGDQLVISYIGYTAKTLEVNSSVINIVLDSSNELDEVVVTGIGLTKSEGALAYNVQSVEGEEISYKQNEDFVNSLNGTTSGV